MLSEGSSVKGSPEDEHASVPYIREVLRFHNGSLWHSTPVTVTRCSMLLKAAYVITIGL